MVKSILSRQKDPGVLLEYKTVNQGSPQTSCLSQHDRFSFQPHLRQRMNFPCLRDPFRRIVRSNTKIQHTDVHVLRVLEHFLKCKPHSRIWFPETIFLRCSKYPEGHSITLQRGNQIGHEVYLSNPLLQLSLQLSSSKIPIEILLDIDSK